MLELSQLGKKSNYETAYNAKLLFPIPRTIKRQEIGIDSTKFYGVDIWTHYEISWLNLKGKPCIAIGEISYPSNSANIIESKSMKLYFNSLNGTKFKNSEQVINLVNNDLSSAVAAPVEFKLFPIDTHASLNKFNGVCLDEQDINCDTYQPYPEYLTCSDNVISEEVYSNLLKSNCSVTFQPDWGSIYINYTGAKIDHAGLLKYIISLRDHNEFHEQCVERVFNDIMNRCHPEILTVYARYTRRGGLDINPYRTTDRNFKFPENNRLIRQ